MSSVAHADQLQWPERKVERRPASAADALGAVKGLRGPAVVAQRLVKGAVVRGKFRQGVLTPEQLTVAQRACCERRSAQARGERPGGLPELAPAFWRRQFARVPRVRRTIRAAALPPIMTLSP